MDDDEKQQDEDDPFAMFRAPAEPVRRWIDDTGTHETIGRLVEVHPDRIRILKLNGAHATVPLRRLSAVDRGYVAEAGPRLATAERAETPAKSVRSIAPATNDTAGL